MTTTHLEPTHVRCFEDFSYTDLEGRDPEDVPCAQCEDNGTEDPWCVVPVAIVPCPSGVTAADWAPGGYRNGKTCDDDTHEPRSGNHIIELDQ